MQIGVRICGDYSDPLLYGVQKVSQRSTLSYGISSFSDEGFTSLSYMQENY